MTRVIEEERANYNRQINDAGELDSIFSSLSNSEPKKEEKETFMDSKDEILDFTDVTSDNGQQETDSIPSFFNPLEEPIQERNYNRIDTKDVGDIEEPEFGGQGQFENVEDVPPVFEVEEVEEVPREKVTDKIKNEAFNELDSTEKNGC